MPRVAKLGTYEAQWAADDEYIVNERTGPLGKCMAGRIRIMLVETGARWYVTPVEFVASGWAAVFPEDVDYFTAPPRREAA